MKTLITILFIDFTIILFSQNTASIEFGSGPDCRGNSGICTFAVNSSKSNSNMEIIYTKNNNELIFVIYKSKIENSSKLKLTNNELEKGFYLYSFDEDFILPIKVLNQLNITEKTKIKQGNYLVKEQGNSLILKLKLE